MNKAAVMREEKHTDRDRAPVPDPRFEVQHETISLPLNDYKLTNVLASDLELLMGAGKGWAVRERQGGS